MPHLRERVRPTRSDDSRHLLCPHCAVRTRLNTLGDGRKKCTVCGRKFRIHKVTEENKLQQCAEILLCFCIDFSAHRTANLTQHRYRLVAGSYDHFRRLIAEKSLPPEKIEPSCADKEAAEVPREKSWCRWCRSRIRTGKAGGKTPVFGVRFRENGEVFLDPLKDDEAMLSLQRIASGEGATGCRGGYAGFICCGKFHRFAEDAQAKDKAEQLWTWIRERIDIHHGIWKRNPVLYLKELEWKYNNRALHPDLQARKFIGLMPADFLTGWPAQNGNQTGCSPPGKSPVVRALPCTERRIQKISVRIPAAFWYVVQTSTQRTPLRRLRVCALAC